MHSRTFTSMILALGVSAIVPLSASAASKGKVLVVLSSEHRLVLKDGKQYETGYFLNELAVPLKKIVDAGYTPVFANPDGKPSAMDKNSVDKMFFGNDDSKKEDALKFLADVPALKKPQRLSQIAHNPNGYVGVFIPGGHAPLQDLVTDQSLGKILNSFHQRHLPTGIICHGPIAMIAALPDSRKFMQLIEAGEKDKASQLAAKWPYKNYNVTAFATEEEKQIEGEGKQLGGYVRFYATDALAAAGANISNGAAWASNVVVDRELVTGQQPLSADAFGDAFVSLLHTGAQQ